MRSANAAAPAEILLVDDDEDYAYLTRRAFGQVRSAANVHHVDDGKKAMAFLRKLPPYADVPAPDIVLLDLDMPVMDGRQVLAEIVDDAALRHLPVVVLTSRDRPADAWPLYQLRCSSYVCKRTDFDDHVDMIRTLADYWLSVVMLPARRPPETSTRSDQSS